MENLKALIEALLFASDVPLAAERLAEILSKDGEPSAAQVRDILADLQNDYEIRAGGFSLQAVAGGVAFRTRPEMAPWISRLKTSRPSPLSPAALESLAVIAYRQPIVKADVDRIRGVDTGGVLKGLLDRKLIRIVGRKDVPGKPILYGTTKKFLEAFNLRDLTELPTLQEMQELQAGEAFPQPNLFDAETE